MAPKQQQQKQQKALAERESKSPQRDSHGDDSEVEEKEQEPQRTELQQMIHDRVMRELGPRIEAPAASRDDTTRPARQQAARPVRAAEAGRVEEQAAPGAKVKWDAANDRKLLLFGLGREISSKELQTIADSFPEKPTRKAIENRVLRLRKESLDALRGAGIYGHATTTAAGEGEDESAGESRPRPRARSDPGVVRNNLDDQFGAPVIESGDEEGMEGVVEEGEDEDDDELYE